MAVAEVAEVKLCKKCGEAKPVDDFAIDRRKPDGRYYWCKSCKRADDKRRRDDPVLGARLRETNQRWAREHPERMKQIRRRRSLKRIGITPEFYDMLIIRQGGACAICRSNEPSGGENQTLFCVDHDHLTGAIRGLLCHPCNRGIGQFKDDVERLRAAVAYLEKEGPLMVAGTNRILRMQSKRTHCKNGHPFDDANTYHRPDRPTTRGCRSCRREAEARRRTDAD